MRLTSALDMPVSGSCSAHTQWLYSLLMPLSLWGGGGAAPVGEHPWEGKEVEESSGSECRHAASFTSS